MAKKPAVVEGLAAGADRARLPDLGRALGDSLVRVSDAWLPGGKFAVPQPCPEAPCPAGPFGSTQALRTHLKFRHPTLGDRDRWFLCDRARRTAVQQAMNGSVR